MEPMLWEHLLSTTRVKGLYGLGSSHVGGEDKRSEFERDYGRSVFCTPVRRLQDKAQVFPLEEHDAVHTRLTHSLEVSSVARGLAQRVANVLFERKQIDLEQRDSFATIAATCGLIHDLGNPPFGHAGEEAISEWFKKRSPAIFDCFKEHSGSKIPEECQLALDFLRFEGNAQTQRLLSRLQILADDFGLNLTAATLSASCKYVANSETRDTERASHKKHGYFASENDLITLLRKETGTGESRHPISILVEASDDIVYALVDLEDGIRKKCLSWEEMKCYLIENYDSEMLQSSLRKAKDKLRDATLKGKALEEGFASAFRTAAITEMVKAVADTFITNYDDIMNGKYNKEILYDSPACKLAEGCKALAADRVYVATQVIKRELMGKKIITELMDIYWQAAEVFDPTKKLKGYPKRVYSLISPNYRHVFERSLREGHKLGIPAAYFRMQLVTDQISGMTDTYAVTLHRELTNG